MQEAHEDEEQEIESQVEGEEGMPKHSSRCQHNRCRRDGEYAAGSRLYCADHIDEANRKVALDWCKAHPEFHIDDSGFIKKLPQTPSETLSKQDTKRKRESLDDFT